MKSYSEVALFEHQFWLQVLGDHGRFILDALSPKETEEITKAETFIDVFDHLLAESRQGITEVHLNRLNNQALEYAKAIREFKLDIIKQHLVGDISIDLPPTFLNHMVNEVDEYLRILPFLIAGQVPPLSHPLHHHLVWLLDAAGHSDAIVGSLDLVEKQLRETGEAFTKKFEHFYIKAVELAGYLRANVDTFPALVRFNNQVELEIIIFKTFLDELQHMEMQNISLSTFSALMADHMAREECYYLTKLAESTQEVKQPDCNPTKPRIID
ncbi:DUF2935 domain-containing protein [Anaerobacillus alkaliphilus]|uniref:DUF2935 domain-containing protein n=1 Tax=Anaerobacillus alkaliphilus TaxID=1548597 RepID=A0A4Q0VZ03_9BACI|nr:DUF2935 domain-containing protein [Anaerobacillus alkaliphilus]RXJ03861.1 DUF2935 domain-containing protein [Anaerobacillus alkaliphilus]